MKTGIGYQGSGIGNQKIPQGDVHLWCVNLSDIRASTDSVYSTANGSGSDSDCSLSQKTFTKIIVRKILSSYLNCPPDQIEFIIGDHGKPSIKNSTLQFNVSDSGDYLLLGVTQNNPIGVDIECTKRNVDYLALAKRFFTAQEYDTIRNSADQQYAFFRCWTQKEAFIKATGMGLSYGLSNFNVEMNQESFLIDDFYVRSITVDVENYAAAVAVQSLNPIFSIQYYFEKFT